jgi:signal peptidase I
MSDSQLFRAKDMGRLFMKKWIRDNRGFLVFILLFSVFRTAIADWNPIPSGSMRPNILEGDVVLVNRIAYDLKFPLTDVVLAHLGDPQRGDIVTFTSPADGKRLIKRLVALPGDVVEMRGKQLIINGIQADYKLLNVASEPINNSSTLPVQHLTERFDDTQRTIQWLPDLSRASNFGPVIIPENQYLMLGDNRDNSADSRYIGFIQRKALIGRAERILVSAAILDNWIPRAERFGKSLY